MPLLLTRGLSKDYELGFLRSRKHRVLDRLDLSVEEGMVFGLIGANGAGKTTTLKILMGLISASEGEASLFDKPLGDRNVQSQIGYLPEQPYFYDYLSGRELLRYFGRLFNLTRPEASKRADELLERVGMSSAADMPLRKYSKGMTQRIGIAQTLINRPKLVLFDEPMSGLDPIGRREIAVLVRELRDSGVTVLFCSHVLPDVEALCDEVAILNRGRLIGSGPLEEILDMATHTVEVVVESPSTELASRIQEMARTFRRTGARLSAEFSQEAFSECLPELHAGTSRLISVHPVKQTLEDYFVDHVGESQAVP